LADFNEDGLPDLATTTWYYGTIEVFLNTGSRTFGAPLTLRGGPPGHGGNELPLALTDVNGDAHVDIIAGGVNNPTVVTYLGRGNGTFASGSWFQTNVHALSLALGDFDGDTELDLAIGAFSNLLSASRSCATQVDLRAVSPVITTGMPAPLQVLVSGVAADTPLPLGTVTFREGATTLGSNNIDAKGFAQFDASGLSTGDHAIIAEFSGNTTLGAATSTSILQKVTTSITTTTFVFPAAGSSYGKQFTFSVVVRNQSNAEISGVYVLTVDGVETFRVIGTTFLSLAPGQHTFSARFFGDSVNPPSETGPVVITTAKAAVGMANVGDVTVPLGSAHNIRISVSGPSGVLAPTGTVQLMRGTTLLGAGTLTGGIASVSATLERGTHEVIATYSGDGNFAARSASFTLTVVQNAPLAIDARGLQDGIAIRAVVPANANAMTLYRSVSGSGVWTMVAGWSTSSEVDSWASLKRGTLYDYRLDVNVGGVLQSSNIDSALFFNDDPLSVAATTVKRIHFTELRDAINALRANAGLQPFNFDDTFDTHEVIRAAHVTAMRNAVAEARATLGMAPLTFTDATPTGMAIRAVHIRELRDATH
jgi:hypothetical protein